MSDDASRALPPSPFSLPPSFVLLPPSSDLLLAIGPEGGFTDDEVASARNAGWRLVDLGPRILRVETAAIVLAAMVIHGYGKETA